MFDGIGVALGFSLLAVLGSTISFWLLWSIARRWAPSPIRGRLKSFPATWALLASSLVIIPIGCVWALTPVPQPASMRQVRAMEVPLKSTADRADLVEIIKRHGMREGLVFVDATESWRYAAPRLRKSLDIALDRPSGAKNAWEIVAYDEGKGSNPWVVFFYGVDPARAKSSRERLASQLKARFRDVLEVPVLPNGSLPLREDLERTTTGYEVRSERAAAYGLSTEERESQPR